MKAIEVHDTLAGEQRYLRLKCPQREKKKKETYCLVSVEHKIINMRGAIVQALHGIYPHNSTVDVTGKELYPKLKSNGPCW